MQQLTQEKPSTALPEILLQLRQSMAGADSFAISTHEPSAALQATLDSLPEAQRDALLLHALDEAIGAIELAARLADALNSPATEASDFPLAPQPLHVPETGNQTGNLTEDPLFAAYRAFTESQPMYQDLYHYRNALAERLASDGGDFEA
ncbi:MAG TPA: hypothetical protein VF510_14935 [Ktedonobacterales bacterium]